MQDRVALFPGRVKLVPVSGQTNVYDLTRQDSPTVEGTPLNKANLLADATCEAIGITADTGTPNDAFVAINAKANSAIPKVKTLSLPTASWTGSASPYTQTVTIAGTSAKSKADIQVNDDALTILIDSGTIAVWIENDNGTLTAKAKGEKPNADLTVQVTISLVATGGTDPPQNSAAETLSIAPSANGQNIAMQSSSSKHQAVLKSTSDVNAIGTANGSAKQGVKLASLADPIVAAGIDSFMQENAMLENAAVGDGIIVNLLSQTERLNLCQLEPDGDGITVNPNTGGQYMELVQSAPDGNGLELNQISPKQKIGLLLPVPSGDAANAVPALSTSGLAVSQPASNGTEISVVNSDAGNTVSASNDGEGNAGNCADGENTNNIVTENTAAPEIIVMADMLSALGMKVTGTAEGAAYVPWEYPVNKGGILTITQVYSAVNNQGVLEVT